MARFAVLVLWCGAWCAVGILASKPGHVGTGLASGAGVVAFLLMEIFAGGGISGAHVIAALFVAAVSQSLIQKSWRGLILHKLPTAGGLFLAKGAILCGGIILGIDQFMQNPIPPGLLNQALRQWHVSPAADKDLDDWARHIQSRIAAAR